MNAALQVTCDAIRRICAWNFFFHEKKKSASRRCMHSGRFNLNNKDINLDVDS